MPNNFFRNSWWWPLLFLGVLMSCAQVKSLDGGQKDTQAPQLLSIFPEQQSTRFKANTIVLTFDEYVQVNDLSTELVVSPPLDRMPIARVKKRSVFVELQEPLEENTTYTFNFGNAISDINEGNKLDLVYVISTGDYIDSLKIKGTVKDAWKKEPFEGLRVMLYRNASDTVVLKKTPSYFTKVDKSGNFELSYLSPGAYVMAALEDKNANYSLEDDERMAFLDSLVSPGVDNSTLQAINLLASFSKPEKPSLKDYKVDSLGVLKMPWDKRFEPPVVKRIKDDTRILSKRNGGGDSLVFVLPGAPTDMEEEVVVAWRDSVLDSLSMPFFKEELDKNFLCNAGLGKKQKFDKPFRITMPAGAFIKDPSKAYFLQDSTQVDTRIELDSAIAGVAYATGAIEKGHNCSLVLLPGAFGNNGAGTNDSVLVKFQTFDDEDLGTLLFDLSGSSFSSKHRFQLVNAKGEVVYEKALDSDTKNLVIKELEPSDYYAYVWFDENANGVWDGANYSEKKQPEKSWALGTKINVRANWEIRQKWPVN
jgi:Bacterial Ig-like domain